MKKFNKTIHQIWFQGKDKVPNKFLLNIEKTKKNLKNWNYILWDNNSIKELLKTMNPKYLRQYNNYKHLHQKVDYGRYCILYKLGGFYVDMDAYIIKDPSYIFKKFPNYEVYVSKGNFNLIESLITNGIFITINNGIILAKKKSDFMYNLINKCPTKTYFNFMKMLEINFTTGPRKFSLIANNSKKIKILQNEYFEPCLQSICNINDNTITIHKHELSWINPNLGKILIIYIKYRIYIQISIFLFLCIIVYSLLNKKSK